MRTQKLGSRFLRVVTADRKVHYFSTPGFCSLRVFWIFRNFSNIDDRVLSARQLQLIQRICNTQEVSRESVDFARLIGTIELSTACNQGWINSKSPAVASPTASQSTEMPAVDCQPPRLPSTVVSATAVAACLLVAVTILAQAPVRQEMRTVLSRSLKSLASMLPRIPREPSSRQHTPEQPAPEASLVKLKPHGPSNTSNAQLVSDTARSNIDASLIGTEETAELRPATLRIPSLTEPRAATSRDLQAEPAARAEPAVALSAAVPRPSPRKRAAVARLAAMAEGLLPPSGPPQSHPVPSDLPEVSKDTKVILRAIVSSDGKVSRVHVVEGNPVLAREAARAVTSWRYSPRAGSGDAESRIVFQFAPDVTTVSFLSSGSAKIAR